MAQLGLFDVRESPAADSGPLALPEAAPMAGRPVYLGTSSWNFPGWAGLVYPPGLDIRAAGLAAYARHPLLRAVGLDRTYYAPLARGDFEEYAAQVPADFRFVVKALRELTTPRLQLPATARPVGPDRFLDASHAVRVAIAPVLEGLGERCGGIVFQFPPLARGLLARADMLLARLDAFLRALPAGPSYFVELRNPELYSVDYFRMLMAAGAEPCYTVHPGAPEIARQQALAQAAGADGAGALLVRWNLRRDLRYAQARERFAPFARLVAEDLETRGQVADLVSAALGRGQEVMVIANNKAEGCAPLTLARLADAIGERLAATG